MSIDSLVGFTDRSQTEVHEHEYIIECSHCGQKYLLVWDDKEWNYIKDWIHLPEFAVGKSYPGHGEVGLPATLKKPPKRRC